METIEEIGEENREYFEESGGEKFGYIACLNERDDHTVTLENLVLQHLQGWGEWVDDVDLDKVKQNASLLKTENLWDTPLINRCRMITEG